MIFLQKLQDPLFWKNFAKVAIPFFIAVTVISLLFNSWSPLFKGDFTKVNAINFANGKWIVFWGTKIVFSFFYGLLITYKNMK